MSTDTSLNTNSYRNFLEHAEEHFNEISELNPGSFSCKEGCHACCEADLTVLEVEANNIRAYLNEHPEVVKQLQEIEQTDPHQGTRCKMLNAQGKCSIYPVRPFICRSHGAPIAIAQEDYFQIDVCPLNFTDNPIEELGPENFFILDDWNEVLLNCATTGTRVALTLQGLGKRK